MLSITVEVDGAARRFDTLALSARDLEKPLRVWGAIVRKKAVAIVKAQDFAPLAESTVAKRQQRGLRTLDKKLQGDVRKAMKRARLARGPERVGLLDRLLSSADARRATEDALSSQTRGVKSRQAVLAFFQQKHHRKIGDRAQLAPLSVKQMASIGAREDRALARAVGAPILGGLVHSYVVEVDGPSVTVSSRTHEHFTEVLNKGGRMGHGAVAPARDTLPDPSSDDMDLFAQILVEHHLLAAYESA